MTRLAALLLVIVLAQGCALLRRDRTLADADAQAARGDYKVALAGYDAYLKDNPDDERARTVRAVMSELVSARAELAALRDRSRGESSEIARLRQELAARQAEVARLKQDLEALKRADLQLERQRR
jgi:hypothetical protein